MPSKFLIIILALIQLSCDDSYDYGKRTNPYDPNIPGGFALKEIIPLTEEINAVSPSWSADEARIVYQTGDRGKERIVVMNSNGSGKDTLALLEGHSYEWSPRWSPVDNRFAYVDGPDWNIFIRGYKDSTNIQLTDDKNYWNPVWLSDGSKIACLGQPRNVTRTIWIIDPVTLEKQKTYEDSQLLLLTDWSLANNELIFITRKTGEHSMFFMNMSTFEISPFPINEKVVYGEWLSDGNKILYTVFKNNRYEVWVSDRDGNNGTVLVTEDRYPELKQVLFMSISKDTSFLLFESSLFPATTIFERGLVTNIYIADLKY